MPRSIQVLIIDPWEKRRVTLQRLLAQGGIATVGEADYGQEAYALAAELKPHLAVLALEEPMARALNTLETLRLCLPELPVLVTSSRGDRDTMRRAMLAGASDYLVYPLTAEGVQQAIAAILRSDERRRTQRGAALAEPPTGTVITVWGPKGGIGKTTLATNLAFGLASILKYRTALVDLDGRFGTAASFLDAAMVSSPHDPSRAGEPVLLPSGVAFVGLVEEGEQLARSVREVVPSLARRFDFVVVDTAAILGEPERAALACSTLVLLISSLEVACIRNAEHAVAALPESLLAEGRVKLVVNHANSANSVTVNMVEGALGLPCYWDLPWDPMVGMAAQWGKPLVESSPRSPAGRSLTNLLYALSGVPQPQDSRWQRWWGR